MVMKALYGVSLGLVAFTLFFLGPSGFGITQAAPQKVKVEAAKEPGRSGTTTRHRRRGPRYVFVGGYYRGK